MKKMKFTPQSLKGDLQVAKDSIDCCYNICVVQCIGSIAIHTALLQ